jgi:hypothetical protein
VGGDEANEDEFEDNVDFFEAIVANLELENSKNPTNCWYLDLGATKHMLGDKFIFKGLEKSVKIQNMKSIGGHTHGVYGKGKVKSSNSRKIKTIVDVLYVLGLSKNLLLVGMIANKGNIMVFDFGKCLIIQNKNPNTIMAKGVKDPNNGLYKLEVYYK